VTDEEKYLIGVDFKNDKDKYRKLFKTNNPTWKDLNLYHGMIFSTGEKWRKWTQRRQDKDGTLKKIDSVKDEIKVESLPSYKESVEIKNSGEQISDKLISMSLEESKDPDFVLKSHGYSPDEWVITSAKNSMWNMMSKEDGIRTLYSSKISVKPRNEILLNEDNITKILENLIKNYSIPSLKYIKYNHDTNGDLLILNIADLHFALKSYMETSNNEYDDVIATNRFFYVINDVLSRIKHKVINKIILLNLGDICNFDTPYQTTKGTPQTDHSLSYYSMFTKVSDFMKKFTRNYGKTKEYCI